MIKYLLLLSLFCGCACQTQQNQENEITYFKAKYIGNIKMHEWNHTRVYEVTIRDKTYLATYLSGHTGSFAIGPEIEVKVEK